MTAAAAPIFKIPAESPQPASPRPARGKGVRPAARAKAGRPALGRVIANGTGRAATRGEVAALTDLGIALREVRRR
jgi:hypothetical protein